MPDVSTIILYVRDPLISVQFFSALLGRPPIESSANFAMLPMATNVMLGLWACHDVTPAPTSPYGSGELAIVVADREAVLAAHSEWVGLGIPIIQKPVMMDFGFTYTGLDPDGNRLRVMALSTP
jgi:catechol 2,3-dioxygenase-like lactoylglutathione lyase family enzyme